MKFQFCETNSAHRIEKTAKFNKINNLSDSANRRMERPSKFNVGAILRTPYIRDTHPLQIGRGVDIRKGEAYILPPLKKRWWKRQERTNGHNPDNYSEHTGWTIPGCPHSCLYYLAIHGCNLWQ